MSALESAGWFSLEGRTALVTGGSRGIGKLVAEGLLMAGASVAICARKEHELESTLSELSERGPCQGVVADLSKPESRAELAAWVEATYGGLDVLVNNAGTAWGEPIDDFSVDGFSKVLDLNVTALFDLTRQLLPSIERGATREAPARVINIGSVDGLRVPGTTNYPYSASKAAVHMLTRHMAKDLVDRHVNVNCIAPGLFDTKMTAHWFHESHPQHVPRPPIPMDRGGELVDIAGAAIYLASPASVYVTGVVLPVAGGVSTID